MCNVTNVGEREGDEVVLAFVLPPPGRDDAELKRLFGYERVTLAPGAQTVVHFNTTAEKLSVVDEFGTRHVLPGAHELIFSRGHGEELSQTLRVEMPAWSVMVVRVPLAAAEPQLER